MKDGGAAPALSLRMVTVDHYLAPPVPGLDVTRSEFRGSEVQQVPVLRIFGPSTTGTKTCAHVHGVFPYLYIPCEETDPEPKRAYQIAKSIDKAINISLKRSNSTNQHVYKVILVKGIPFYGYHPKHHQFYKIFFYNPLFIKRTADLLQSGAIMGVSYRPHEAHINFVMQFFIDFNLYGMSLVNLERVKFRRADSSLFHNSPPSDALEPLSVCECELDCLAMHILNRREILNGRSGVNPGLEALWDDEKKRREDLNASLEMAPTPSQTRDNIPVTESHKYFDKKLRIKLIINSEASDKHSDVSIYPAETPDGEDTLNATSIFVHHPTNTEEYIESQYMECQVESIVDEDAVVRQSQNDFEDVKLDSDDLEFMKLLKGMERDVDEDSILSTQVNENERDLPKDEITDDSEKIVSECNFDESRLNMNSQPSQPSSWNDSYWEDVENISQLDGTWDDEAAAKRRKKPLRIGLSKPSKKRKISAPSNDHSSESVNEERKLNLEEKFKIFDVVPIKAAKTPVKCSPKRSPRKSPRNFEPLLKTIYESPSTPRKRPVSSERSRSSRRRLIDVDFNKTYTIDATESSEVFPLPVEESKNLTASQYDRFNNYEPQPGPSHRPTDDLEETLQDDQGIISFYNRTLYNKNDESVSNIKLLFNESYEESFQKNETLKKLKILTPKISPPSGEFVSATIENKCKTRVPFYSDHKDVGAQIEVGSIVLKIKGNRIGDLKEFNSSLVNVKGLISQRQSIFMQNNASNLCVDNLDSVLASNKSYILTPNTKPPSFQSVTAWLEAFKSKRNAGVKEEQAREKIQIYVPKSPDHDFDNSQMEVLSLSSCSSHGDDLVPSQKSDGSEEIACGQKISSDLTVNTTADVINSSEGLISTTNAFRFSGNNYQDADVYHENDYLTILSLELLTTTRGDLNPDPQCDPICGVFYSILNDCPVDFKMPQKETGFIIVDGDHLDVNRYFSGFVSQYKIITVHEESCLFSYLLKIVEKWNPDILCGYEIQMSSWGYLFQRAFALGVNLPSRMSRVCVENESGFSRSDSQDTAVNKEIKLSGRIALDVWRLLRHEVALLSYTFESVMYHVMHERLPSFSFKTLSFWWNHPSKLMKSLCVEYYLTRVTGTIRIMLQLDLIGRTSELARLFGIQWYEVLSRGSQFRVESMMIRLTRTFNYVLVSPSVQQRAAMKAPECLPLILEPESRFYTDPVIVLDFQSLYPSMMIAYNYCFSTCIGKIENIGKNDPFPFGASMLKISSKLLKKLNEQDLINWSPCGVGFVKPIVRKGTLPTMLQNILNTRFMVKKAMKKYKNKTLQKILHNRQLGLKLIANVTYGYTAANFSGRMPCVEVGDSVVAKGRETLERAIKTVENTPKWRAKVVYGDTDSIFVLVPGRSRAEAFEIGEEIASAVTADNPTPVKLKLEKVYQPCILQTKKRYVGYKYESRDQKSPEYEAKGIETVRRDGCPAASKILEKTLKILFDTYDVSKVKSYIYKKFQNIVEGKCNIQDFIFAREFRGMHAYKLGASVPSLEIAKRLKLTDPRKEPREGQRVPYVIVNGAPGEALLTSSRCPTDLLQNPSLRINHLYYITRVIIPPLNRCLTLLGADVNLWFAEMPRKQLQSYPILDNSGKRADGKKITISQYFSKVNCVGCDDETSQGICDNCLGQQQKTMVKLYGKINEWNRNYLLVKQICQSCCGRGTNIDCVSIDCPILFKRNSANQDVQQIPFVEQMKKKLIDF